MPFVYGFRQLPKRAEIYAHPFSGVAIATPVLDLLMRQDNGVVTDRTSYGNNGTCAGCVGARGVFDEGQKFDGVNNQVNCGTPASLNITGDISILAWANPYANAFQAIISKGAPGANRGWALILWNNGGIAMLDSTTPAWRVTALGGYVLPGRLGHICGTKEGTRYRLFSDGLQADVLTGAAAFVASPADNCTVGYESIPRYFSGSIELPQVFSGALSPEQIYRKYLEAKDVPIYLNDFGSYAVTPVAKAVGSMCGPIRVLAQTFSIVVDANGKKWLMGATNGNYADGTGDWMEDNAYGTFEFDIRKDEVANTYYLQFLNSARVATGAATSNGYMLAIAANGGAFLYRWTGGGVGATPITWAAGSIATGTDYRIRIVRRIGGQFAMYIKGGAYPDYIMLAAQATDNTHATGRFYNTTFIAAGGVGNKISGLHRNRVCERPASFPWEFSTGTYSGVVSGSTVWMRCLTAGVTYLPKDLDWLQMNFGIYKGADANVTDLLFMATEIGGTTFANQNGYCLRLAADESIRLIRMSAGVETQIDTTAAGFIAINTEYEIKITHDWALHMFTFYIRGGAYADWTQFFQWGLGIYTSSNYTTWDLDADDRATAPTFRSFPR